MEELSIKTGLVEYMGEMKGGVSIHISFTIYDISFHAVYWIHPQYPPYLECEERFLKLFKVNHIKDVGDEFYQLLLDDINSILPNHDEIYDEFL